MIKRETIDQIMDATKVEEVVGEFVSLKKKGVNFMALCPFHNEKSPSFSVSPVRGIYKCFGCGKGGNAIQFLMDHEQFTYPEALRYLARKYNIDIEESEPSKEEKIEQSERESLYIVMAFARTYFQKQLHESEDGKSIGLSYLNHRGIEDDMIQKFEIGYSPSGRDQFYQDALKAGYTAEILEKAGLVIKTKSGDYMDRFRDRIMFPVFSQAGRPVAFGGRIIRSDQKKEAKYINSPETPIYHKSRILFGLSLAKKEIMKTSACILVEGYTDVIALFQKNIQNVVASSGTSLTEDQLRIIRRYSNNLVFLLDGDEAGAGAASRGIELALKEGLNVKAIALPENEDPDTLASQKNTEELQSFFEENAVNFLDFLAEKLYAKDSEDPSAKSNTADSLIHYIALIPDVIQRGAYIKKVSRFLDIEEQALYSRLNRVLIKNAKEKQKRQRPEAENTEDQQHDENQESFTESKAVDIALKSSVYQERDAFRLLLLFGSQPMEGETDEGESLVNVAAFILEKLQQVKIEDPICIKLMEIYQLSLQDGNIPVPEDLLNTADPDIKKFIVDTIAPDERVSENWKARLDLKIIEKEKNYRKEVKSVVLHLMLKKVKEMIVSTKAEYKKDMSEEEMEEFLKIQLHLLNMKHELSNELRTVIL